MKRATPSKAKARFGRIGSVEGMVVTGWAVDQFPPRGAANLVLLVDDRLVATFMSGLPRPELAALGPHSQRGRLSAGEPAGRRA